MVDLATLEAIDAEHQDDQVSRQDAMRQRLASLENPPSMMEQAMQFGQDAADTVNSGINQAATGATMGLNPNAKDPVGVFEHSARLAGETIPFAIATPLALASKVAPALRTVANPNFIGKISQGIRAIGDDAMETILRKPKTYAATELASGAGAGAGGYVAQDMYPDAEGSQVIGELTGGTLASAPVAMTVGAFRAGSAVVQNLPIVRALFQPTKARVKNRVERATPSPKGAAEDLFWTNASNDPVVAGMTPAQKTGDKGLLSLERAVIESTEELTRASDDQVFDMNEVIKTSLNDVGGNVHFERTREVFEAGSEHLTSLLDTRLRIAAQRADERIAKIKPGSSREQVNRIARKEVERALADANVQEDVLYDLIPEEVVVPTINARTAYNDMVKSLSRAEMDDIPAVAKKFLQKKQGKASNRFERPEVGGDNGAYFGDATTVKEMRGLQKKLGEVSRQARDAGDYNKARIAGDIKRAITEDFSLAKPDNGDVQGTVDAAVSFSRTKADRFGKGATARILGSKNGMEAVAPSLTLDVALVGSGPKSREAYLELRKAVGENPEELAGAVEDYVKDQFVRRAFKGDTFQPSSAEGFLNSNQDMLREFPGLRRDIQMAIDTKSTETLMTRQRDSIGKRLRNPKVSKAALVVGGDPDKIFSSMESSRFPAKEMQKLVNRANKDDTGEAISGLKTAYIDRLLRGSTVKQMDDSFVSGHKMEEMINTPMIVKLFTKAERQRLAVITHTAKNMDLARHAKNAKEGVMGDVPGRLSSTIAQVAAAQMGRQVAGVTGGGTVQTPGIFVGRAKEALQKWVHDPSTRLITDAVQDDGLFRALLLDESRATIKQSRAANAKINAWLAVVGGDIGQMFYSDEEPAGNGLDTQVSPNSDIPRMQ